MLKPTQVSFEYLSDKRANFIFAGLAIPDVSGICPAMVELLFSGWFVGSSDVSRLNCLREFTVLVIPGVSGMDGQRPTASFQMP